MKEDIKTGAAKTRSLVISDIQKPIRKPGAGDYHKPELSYRNYRAIQTYPNHRSSAHLSRGYSKSPPGHYFSLGRTKLAAAGLLAVALVSILAIPIVSNVENSPTARESTFVKPTADNQDQATGANGSSSNPPSTTKSSPTNTTDQPNTGNQAAPITESNNFQTQSPLSPVAISPTPVSAEPNQQPTTSEPTKTPATPSSGNDNTPSAKPAPTSNDEPSPSANKSEAPKKGGIVTNLLSGVLGLLF